MVIDNAKPPFPRPHKKGTFIVYGRGFSNRKMQVIYTLDKDGTAYVIHAMHVR